MYIISWYEAKDKIFGYEPFKGDADRNFNFVCYENIYNWGIIFIIKTLCDDWISSPASWSIDYQKF